MAQTAKPNVWLRWTVGMGVCSALCFAVLYLLATPSYYRSVSPDKRYILEAWYPNEWGIFLNIRNRYRVCLTNTTSEVVTNWADESIQLFSDDGLRLRAVVWFPDSIRFALFGTSIGWGEYPLVRIDNVARTYKETLQDRVWVSQALQKRATHSDDKESLRLLDMLEKDNLRRSQEN